MEFATLVGQHLSTGVHRQRRWALESLAAYAAARDATEVGDVLDPALVAAWLTTTPAAATARVKAAAVRALVDFAATHHLPVPDPTRPAPAVPPKSHPRAPAVALLVAASGDPPPTVPDALWARFAAHLHVQAATGWPERTLTAWTLADIATTDLPDAARHQVGRWLQVRAHLVAPLTGTDPGAVWVRWRPTSRAGTLAPAGLPITARGLRYAYWQVVTALCAQDPTLTPVPLAAVRALGPAVLPGRAPAL